MLLRVPSIKILSLVAGFMVVGIVILTWRSGSSAGRGFASDDSAATQSSASSPHKLPKRDASREARQIERVPGRSSNLRVHQLADKLAKEFERDPTQLVALLSDESLGSLAYAAGRDLITLFPDRSQELLEAFKAAKPVNLAVRLCADLIADVTARMGGKEALALADSLEPGNSREMAFRRLGLSLKAGEFVSILQTTAASGYPEDTRQLENALLELVGNLKADELAGLLSLNLDATAQQAIRGSYGDRLVTDHGRLSALESALALPQDQRGAVIQGVLRRGAMLEEGASWLLESLSRLDSNLELDRRALTIGVTQRMMAQDPGTAMNWAAGISDPDLRSSTVKGGMQSWLQQDSMKASGWLSEQPAGPAKDAAIFQMVTFLLARGDSGSAVDWTNQIQNTQTREALTRKLASAAVRTDR